MNLRVIKIYFKHETLTEEKQQQ